MKKLLHIIVTLVLSFVFSSCTNQTSIISAIEDINIDRRGGIPFASSFDQQAVSNISGVLPYTAIGELTKNTSKFSTLLPSENILISNSQKDNNSKISQSQVMEMIYDFPYPQVGSSDPYTTLANIKKSFIDVQYKAQDYLTKRLELTRLKIGVLESEPKSNTKNVLGKNPKETKNLAPLENAERKMIEAREAYLSAEKDAFKQTTLANVIIARWDRSSFNNINGAIANTFGFESDNIKKKSGFVILGGLKVSHLKLGTDIQCAYEHVYTTSRSLITHMWQSKYILSFSTAEFENNFKANLEAKYEQFSDISKLFLDSDKIEIDMVMKSFTRLGNSANLIGLQRKESNINWEDKDFGLNIDEDEEKWSTFYAVSTYVNDLKGKVGSMGSFWTWASNFLLPF